MSKTVTLAQAMESAGTAVYLCKQKCDSEFGDGLFERAVTHHTQRNLRADIAKGETRDVDGWQSRLVSWGADDAAAYDTAPHFVWFDFFLGFILNSASRMSRGVNP